jgi:hypothetical protein
MHHKTYKLYLAARYSRREEICTYRRDLEKEGFEVTSRWLDGKHGKSYEANNIAQHVLCANEDSADLMRADALVLFTPGGRHGGLFVEFGGALFTGRPCFICGPLDGAPVFAFRTDVYKTPNWSDCMFQLSLWKEHLEEVRSWSLKS